MCGLCISHCVWSVTGYRDVDDRKEEQLNKFKEFLPQLVDKLSHMSTEYVSDCYHSIALSYNPDSTNYSKLVA